MSDATIYRCARLLTIVWAMAVPAFARAQAVVPDGSRGRQLVESRCFACHSLDTHRAGPALRGVVGRGIGKAEGFDYSNAMRVATNVWTELGLKAWLANPEDVVPGQRMNYFLEHAQDREDVVAYLAALSKTVHR